MSRVLRNLIVACCIAACAPGASARQDDPPPLPEHDGEFRPLDPADADVSPERMKENLQRQLDRNARERQALDEAIEMLKRGEPVMKVREHMRGVMRDGLRDRAQQFREGRRAGPPGPPPGGGRPDEPGEFDGPERRPGGPPPGGPPDGPGRGGPRPMERLFGVLRETNPGMAERLERLRREDPEQFQKLFDEYAPRLARLAEERDRLPDRWPDRVKQLLLQRRAGSLAREIAAMPADQQAEATTRLRANLGEQFDIRLKFAREDLERAKQHSQRLQSEIAENSSDRDAAIEKQMSELLSQAREGGEPPPVR